MTNSPKEEPKEKRNKSPESRRLKISLALTTVLAGGLLHEPLVSAISQIGYRVMIATSNLSQSSKEQRLREFEEVKMRTHRRRPNVEAYKDESEAYMNELKPILDGTASSVDRLTGKYSPTNIIHRFEKLQFGVSDGEYVIAQAGLKDFLGELRAIAPPIKPDVEFLDEAMPIVAPPQAFDITRSVSLDAFALRKSGIKQYQNCDATAKNWIIALSELYPDLIRHIYIQDFWDHFKTVVEIDGQKYILDKGTVSSFPDSETLARGNVLYPLAGYLAQTVFNKWPDEIEGAKHYGPHDRNLGVPVMLSDRFTLEAGRNFFKSYWMQTTLGYHGGGGGNSAGDGGEVFGNREDDMAMREMHRGEGSTNGGENDRIGRRVQVARDVERARAVTAAAAFAVFQKSEQKKHANDPKPKAVAAKTPAPPQLNKVPVPIPVQDYVPPIPRDRVVPQKGDVDATKIEHYIQVEIHLPKQLTRSEVEAMYKKLRYNPFMANFGEYDSLTLDGAQAISEHAPPGATVSLSTIKEFAPGCWDVLNAAHNDLKRKCGFVFNPHVLAKGTTASEIKKNSHTSLSFTSITPDLLQNLAGIKIGEIHFLGNSISVEEAEIAINLPYSISFPKVTMISDEAAEILLSKKEFIQINPSAVKTYATAKLYLKSSAFLLTTSISANIVKLTPDIARAFRESGKNLSFSMGQQYQYFGAGVSPSVIRELVDKQDLIRFNNLLSITPEAAAEFKPFEGSLDLSLYVLSPQAAKVLTQRNGPLVIRIRNMLPVETARALMQSREALTLNVSHYDKDCGKEFEQYRGKEFSFTTIFNYESLKDFAEHAPTTPVKIFGTYMAVEMHRGWDLVTLLSVDLADPKVCGDMVRQGTQIPAFKAEQQKVQELLSKYPQIQVVMAAR